MDNYTWNISVGKDISSAQENLILISVALQPLLVAVLMRATLGMAQAPLVTSYMLDAREYLSVVVMTLVTQYDL